MENIAKRIRKSKGWSVKRMAEYIGISPRTLEGIEQGRPMSQSVLNHLKKLKPTE